jgi:nitrite reductase (NO-forming)/hydroxylamine reductase
MNTPRMARVAAALMAALAFGAQADDKKTISQPELNYQAGTSPLANEPMYQRPRR